MKLRINKVQHTKKINLVKTGILIDTILPTVLVGCNSIDASKYYLVHNDNNYYICTKGDKYINSCDIEYKSITDDKIVGVICSNNNNFDYQEHHFSTEFLSELQIVPVSDAFDNNSFNYDELKSIALSSEINDLGDKFFKSKEYLFNYEFENYFSISLQVYKTDNKLILGYDISPKRLNGSNCYVYSIIDNDVIKLSNFEVEAYDISKYFNDNDFVTYDTALELSTSKELEKVLHK